MTIDGLFTVKLMIVLLTSAFVLMRLEAVSVRTRGNTAVHGHPCHRSGESLPVYLGHQFQKFGSIVRRLLQKIFFLISTRPYRFLGQRVQWTSGAGSLGGKVNRWGLKLTAFLHPVPWPRICGAPPPLSPTYILGAILTF